MEYNFKEIEQKWSQIWKDSQVYKVDDDTSKPKYYVLDMFPYPSGAGLHVGHPLGYIASDIVSRYKAMKGFNVLHPMGFDAFGLPAEQYALETGQHPATTTAINIQRYKEQLDFIGFNYDWSREINTSDPKYYKWTQWLFLTLFNSWFDKKQQKTRKLSELIAIFETEGNANYLREDVVSFDADEWKNFNEAEKRNLLMQYRVAYLDFADVWWCEALNTVLANDEVVNGVSERGGHPVVRKKMHQWFLRITDYADHLENNLQKLQWSDPMKEMQKNWIGKSHGASLHFDIVDQEEKIEVFTTRPDTLYGVDFMVLAPEHDLVEKITTASQEKAIQDYQTYVNSRSERERMSEKKVSGCFTGAYAIHPLTGRKLPVYIAEYVLAGYGTGAIMAVPSGDDRDLAFAHHFDIQVTNIFGTHFDGKNAVVDKNIPLNESETLNGLSGHEATQKALAILKERNLGAAKVSYKLRDAGFSRQRYWGEPFPIVYKNDIPYAINEAEVNLKPEDQQLPVELPHVEKYTPGPEGQGPLANIPEFMNVVNQDGETLIRESNTMPGYAGSSWYFLRFMDPNNDQDFADPEKMKYWNQVDLYIGGTEHAVGHLLYSRMWTKVLHDLGYLPFDEPFKQLLNQGMIQGSSRLVYRVSGTNTFVSHGLIGNHPSVDAIHVDVSIVEGVELDLDAFKETKNFEYKDAEFVLEDGKYICGVEVEKMSKSKYNVVNPDDIVNVYGADTFRMYEMFLGPIEMSKPWDTKGIEGVHRFLRRTHRLFISEGTIEFSDDALSKEEEKMLHQTIQKVGEDIEKFSFNTAISQLMIYVNKLNDWKTNKKALLTPLVKMIAPFAPHLAEECYQALGNDSTVIKAKFPNFDPAKVKDDTKMYPVAINGKSRTQMEFTLDADKEEIEKEVMENEVVQKWLDGKQVKKFIFVPNRMINIVV